MPFFLSMVYSGCLLKVGVVGLNHKTADLALREAMARGSSSLAGEKACFFPHPTILLSTCNRTEIYFSSAGDLAEAHTDLLSFFRSQIEPSVEQKLYSYFHADCFAHLCKVTAGLDSAILAETEIQRQVKIAYERAASELSLPSSLHYVFQKALKVAKSTRNRLLLEQGAPGLYSTLYSIAESYWPTLKDLNILLVGHSQIHRGFASFLQRKGIRRFALATQNPSSVKIEGANVYGRDILEHWPLFDWISCASQSECPLILGKSAKRHLIFDLSVPRNVDPEVGKGGNVLLMNIEQINQKIEETRKLCGDCLSLCESFVWEQVLRLSALYQEGRERAQVV